MKRKAEFSLAWLMARCEEVGECLVWKGHCSDCGQPIGRLPGQKKTNNIRRSILENRDEHALESTQWTYAKCGTTACVHPDHLASRSRAKAMKGIKKTAGQIAAISVARRKTSKYTDAMILEIIQAPKGSVTAIAAKYGMSRQSACNLRAGQWRKTQSAGMFSGLMA